MGCLQLQFYKPPLPRTSNSSPACSSNSNNRWRSLLASSPVVPRQRQLPRCLPPSAAAPPTSAAATPPVPHGGGAARGHPIGRHRAHPLARCSRPDRRLKLAALARPALYLKITSLIRPARCLKIAAPASQLAVSSLPLPRLQFIALVPPARCSYASSLLERTICCSRPPCCPLNPRSKTTSYCS
jgi:hypothetical protein